MLLAADISGLLTGDITKAILADGGGIPDAQADIRRAFSSVSWVAPKETVALRQPLGLVSQQEATSTILEIAALKNWDDKSEHGLNVLSLANPSWPEGALKDVNARRNVLNGWAQAALAANPKLYSEPWELKNTRPELDMFHAACLAAYGDLSDSKIRAKLSERLLRFDLVGSVSSSVSLKSDGVVIFAGISQLLKRSDVPDDMICEMDKSIVCGTTLYRQLVHNPVHRKLITSGKLLFGLEKTAPFFNRSMFVLPPDLPFSRLQELYEYAAAPGAPGTGVPQAVIATRVNSAELFDRACKDRIIAQYLPELLKEGLLPDAEQHLLNPMLPNSRFDALATLENTSPNSLKLAFDFARDDAETAKPILLHKNFPWRSTPLLSLGTNTALQDMGVVMYACASGSDARLDKRDINVAFASLFGPDLSSHQINKIVAEHPALTPIAVCHQNGFEVAVSPEITSALGGLVAPAPMLLPKTNPREPLAGQDFLTI